MELSNGLAEEVIARGFENDMKRIEDIIQKNIFSIVAADMSTTFSNRKAGHTLDTGYDILVVCLLVPN